jgi:hypothetical protein
MATVKSKVFPLNNVHKEVDTDLTVTIASNGFVVKVSGRSNNDDWSNVTVICNTINDLETLINQIKALNG